MIGREELVFVMTLGNQFRSFVENSKCRCPVIPRYILRALCHVSAFGHWKRVYGCCICFEVVFCHPNVSVCVTGCCRDCSFVDNVACKAFTIKRVKVLVSARLSVVNLIAFIQDLSVVVFISCELMFNLQEILGPNVHILSTHGHIFVTFFAFLLHFC